MNNRLKETIRYVLPSVAAMLVTFSYVVVDGIFVGRGVGENALASVNIALPFTVMISALAAMITVGGATVTAIRMGRGDKQQACDAFLTSGMMALLFGVIFSALGVFFPEQIAKVSGASVVLMTDTAEYIRYFSMFAIFSSLGMCAATFVRNDGRPGLAFWGMVAGALSNVFLDWLFIFPLGMGIRGAAIASGVGQIFSLAILSTHFISKKGELRIRRFHFSFALVGKVLKRGLPELVTQLNSPITILCYNYVVIRTLGEMGVAAFSIICYLTSLIVGVFIGVSQGLQPLIGRSFGGQDKAGVRFFFHAGLVINIGLSAAIYLILLLGGKAIIAIFNPNEQLIALAYEIVKVYGFSFIFASINIILTTYFFSTKHTKQATIIAISRSIVFNILFILTFPILLGVKYIWFAIVLTELLTVLIGFGLKRHTNRAINLSEPLR